MNFKYSVGDGRQKLQLLTAAQDPSPGVKLQGSRWPCLEGEGHQRGMERVSQRNVTKLPVLLQAGVTEMPGDRDAFPVEPVL